jgi:hypothetical protein
VEVEADRRAYLERSAIDAAVAIAALIVLVVPSLVVPESASGRSFWLWLVRTLMAFALIAGVIYLAKDLIRLFDHRPFLTITGEELTGRRWFRQRRCARSDVERVDVVLPVADRASWVSRRIVRRFDLILRNGERLTVEGLPKGQTLREVRSRVIEWSEHG